MLQNNEQLLCYTENERLLVTLCQFNFTNVHDMFKRNVKLPKHAHTKAPFTSVAHLLLRLHR